jgi:hypothetical protein
MKVTRIVFFGGDDEVDATIVHQHCSGAKNVVQTSALQKSGVENVGQKSG